MHRVSSLILLAALVGGCAPRASGPSEQTDWSTLPGAVRVGDTPTVKQVAKAYPELAGAKRWFIPWQPIPIDRSDRTCSGDWAVPLAAETGRLAVYDDRDGRQYEPGFAAPTIGVYGFATPAGAKSAFEHLTKLFDRCMGERTVHDTRITQRAIDVPPGLIGYRRATETPDGEGGVTDQREVEIVLRDDNKLVRIWVQEFGGYPDLQPALALVEPSRAAAGSAPAVHEEPAPGARRIDRRTRPIRIADTSDLSKVPAEPIGLRAQVGRDLAGLDPNSGCANAIELTVIRTDGFARGRHLLCDAEEPVLYVRRGETWRTIKYPTPLCVILEKHEVPSSVGGDWCVLKDGDDGVDYPRRG